jgi:hypothetical protein
LLGPYGEAKASERGDEISLQDTAGWLRDICRAIDELESANGEKSDSQQKKEKKYSTERIRGERKFKKILERVCDETRLPFVSTGFSTSFEIDFPNEDKEFTLGEIMDVLNTQLQKRSWMILRRPTSMSPYPADKKIPPEILAFVPPQELDRWGKTEWVKTRVQLKNRKAADVVKQIQKMLSKNGEAAPSEKGDEISLQDAAGRLRDVCRAIEKLDAPKK